MTCSWPIDRSQLPPLPHRSDPPTVDEQEAYEFALQRQVAMEDLAVNVLWSLSGRQFGVCPVVVRPCANEIQPGDMSVARRWPYRPNLSRVIIDNFGAFLGCGCSGGGCRLSGPSAVHLPGPVNPNTPNTPVVVTFGHNDGPTVLDASEYVVEGDVLIRRKGKPWPAQDYTRPMGERDTWSVQYWRGTQPPAVVAYLVGILTNEFLQAITGDGKCRLPKSVTRMSRQGVNYELDPLSLYQSGKTGIPEIDSWLASVNPGHFAQAPSVL